MGILNRLKKTQAKESTVESPKVQIPTLTPSSGKGMGFDVSGVIVKPLISEKAAHMAGINQYVFVVRKNANRLQVREAIKAMYGVSPLSINILNVQGKKVRFGRSRGVRSDWKKAVITLPAGQSINVHEGV